MAKCHPGPDADVEDVERAALHRLHRRGPDKGAVAGIELLRVVEDGLADDSQPHRRDGVADLDLDGAPDVGAQ